VLEGEGEDEVEVVGGGRGDWGAVPGWLSDWDDDDDWAADFDCGGEVDWISLFFDRDLEEDRAKSERFEGGFWDDGCCWATGFSGSWGWVAIRERAEGEKEKEIKGKRDEREEDEPHSRLAGPGRDDEETTTRSRSLAGHTWSLFTYSIHTLNVTHLS
jgi:hypothetical protein